MNKGKYIHRISMSFMIGCLCTAGFLPVHASDEYVPENKDAPEVSDGAYYEYTAMDENGVIQVIKLPEIDEEAIQKEKMEQADSYDVVLSLGNEETVIATYDTLEEAENKAMMRNMMRSVGTAQVRANTDYSKIKYGVVDFHTKPNSENTYYTETQTGYSGYLNGSSAADGAFLGYCTNDKSKIKFRMSGIEGCVNSEDVIVRDFDDAYVSFYRVENGVIRHYLQTNVTSAYYPSVINVGPMQNYMKSNVVYFSYDGHYFYTDYNTMIDDYKNNTYAHAINPNQPYYNYYQYLSHRSKTSVSADQLNAYTKSMVDYDSKMLNLGSAFIDNQNKYGANALLMFGVAANESAWGTSNIALEKNNLFGHNATDFNPGENADSYSSPADSVEHHAKNFISDGYLDPKDMTGRYFGAHLGDKASGMNVKYASDPYWGEKAAAIANLVAQKNGNQDFGKYQIGIVDKMTNLQIRKDANSSSTALYSSKNLSAFPVLILSQTTGESVSGNNVWYKIQSDPTLNGNRSASTQGTYVYDFANMYGYVSSQYVNLVKYSNTTSNIPNDEKDFIKGDVNGNGKIDAADYLIIMDTILGKYSMNDNQKKKGDVNENGKIDAADYLMIMDHILGKITIK